MPHSRRDPHRERPGGCLAGFAAGGGRGLARGVCGRAPLWRRRRSHSCRVLWQRSRCAGKANKNQTTERRLDGEERGRLAGTGGKIQEEEVNKLLRKSLSPSKFQQRVFCFASTSPRARTAVAAIAL